MRQVVFRAFLDAEKSRHANFVEGKMIGSEGTCNARLEQFQFVQRRENLVHQLAVLIIVVQPQCQNPACSRVMHENGGNFVQIFPVRLHIFLRAVKPLLFARKQHKPNRPLWSQV